MWVQLWELGALCINGCRPSYPMSEMSEWAVVQAAAMSGQAERQTTAWSMLCRCLEHHTDSSVFLHSLGTRLKLIELHKYFISKRNGLITAIGKFVVNDKEIFFTRNVQGARHG